MIIKEFEVTVTLTQTLIFPIDEGETESDFKSWLNTPQGKQWVIRDFRKQMGITYPHKNTDIEYFDICIRETEYNRDDEKLRWAEKGNQ